MTTEDIRSTREVDEQWTPCPKGTLGQIAKTAKTQSRRQFALKVTSAAAAACGVITVGWVALDYDAAGSRDDDDFHTSDPKYAGIRCSEVLPQLASYVRNEVDDQTRTRIDAHLKKCSHCRSEYEKLIA